RLRAFGVRPLFSAAHGWAASETKHRTRASLLPRAPHLAVESPDPQASWDPLMEIFKEFSFEAAHHLPNVPEGHKCRRLHGHSFRCEIHVRGPIDGRLGWVADFADLKEAFAPLHQRLDHNYLNEVDGLENPTSENLARWIWRALRQTLPGLSAIVVRETCT